MTDDKRKSTLESTRKTKNQGGKKDETRENVRKKKNQG